MSYMQPKIWKTAKRIPVLISFILLISLFELSTSLAKDCIPVKVGDPFPPFSLKNNLSKTEIETLQYFRDNFLLQNQLGRLFVRSYYLLSPPCAKLIEKSRLTKKLAERLLLRPIIVIIKHTCKNALR